MLTKCSRVLVYQACVTDRRADSVKPFSDMWHSPFVFLPSIQEHFDETSLSVCCGRCTDHCGDGRRCRSWPQESRLLRFKWWQLWFFRVEWLLWFLRRTSKGQIQEGEITRLEWQLRLAREQWRILRLIGRLRIEWRQQRWFPRCVQSDWKSSCLQYHRNAIRLWNNSK